MLMKKLSLVVAFIMAGVVGFAQGTVNFSNTGSAIGGTGAPVTDVDGTTRLAGTGFLAQLYAGPDAASLVAVPGVAVFRTGAGAGFVNAVYGTFTDSSRAVGNVAPGANATIVMRAWDAAAGATYEAALGAGGKVGSSTPFTVALGGAGSPPSLPANLVGLTSFSLSVIPEPSTIALGLLGLAALALRRRK